MSWLFSVFKGLSREVVVCFINIGKIVDHQCLNIYFWFNTYSSSKMFYYDWFDFWCLTPLSAIFQLYHGDQFQWRKKPEYPERTIDHGQATGKLYNLRLRVECTLFCNLQTRTRTHAVLVVGLYELLGNPRSVVKNIVITGIV